MKTNHILKRFGVWLLPFLLPMAATAAHNYVDLGLPSGTLWADCNVGASSPEGYGNFYAWGETKTKSTYSWSNYQYASGSSSTTQNIGTHIAGTKYDAATAAWGSDWVMPTIDQANELIHECTLSLATVNNVKGMRFKGPNGNTIFFPMTGYKADSSHKSEGTQCYLWTETKDIVTNVAYKALAMYLERSSSSAKVNTQAAPRRSGVVIRAVRAEGGSVDPDDPDDPDPGHRPYHPFLVDLGLSVKWSEANLDANEECGYGDYFAWGETSSKNTYTWANYQHASGSASTAKDIGINIQATQYDAAFHHGWAERDDATQAKLCLPTREQFEELVTECTWTEKTYQGVKGYMVVGPSGYGIFLPFSGYSYDGNVSGKGSSCYYWTADMDDNIQKASALYIKSGTAPAISAAQRRTGMAIRPVEYDEEAPTRPPYNRETELVDLGLSVRWCDGNLTTDYEAEYGGFYAWGETVRKATYTWANYEHANGSASSVKNIGSNIQGTIYDAAYQNMSVWDFDIEGSIDVCLPTMAQFEELRTKCTWKEATVSGHKGFRVTGPSGKSIFMPLSGCSYDGNAYNRGTSCYYWTSEVSASDAQKANALYLKTGAAPKLSVAQRRTGAVIRAVEYKKPGDPYAVLSSDEKTLTFYCDYKRSSRSGKKFDLNTGENVPDWFSGASSWYSTQTSVTKVVFDSSFANARPKSTYHWFRGMKNLATITGINYLNTSEVTIMKYMFTNCSSLSSINVSNFNTANVTTFESMFEGCSKLSSIDVSKFNTANAVNFYCMFDGCSGLKSLNVSSFNTAKAEKLGIMFANCSGLTSIDVSNFNTAKANIGSMFYQCTGLTSLDLSNFVVNSSFQQNSVVYGCTGLTSLTIPATANNFNSNACYYVGTASKPCVIHAPDGFNFGVSTSGNYFQWKNGYFKLPAAPSPGSHDYVDLGLPSGTLWADCNVGASSPEGYGNFYAWGETKTKSTYSWSNYQYASGSSSTTQDIGTHIAGTKYDAATAAWGSGWVMPTIDQANELIHNCTLSLATVNNVKGIRFKGPNGNTIFFPMTGYKADSSHKNEGTQCYLWTETKDIVTNVAYKALAMYLERSSSSAKVNTQAAPRRSGVVIRPVRAEGGVDPLGPPAMSPELVDLGLSVRWCSQNMGACWESEYGDYYAWGETAPKSTYTWANYKHANGTASTVKNIGSDIQATQYDAAYAWEEVWDDDEQATVCMPTKEQFEELLTKCTWKEATEYGHKGFRVTGPSGESIFLPFAGCSYDGKDYSQDVSCNYWTSEVSASDAQKANVLYIKTGTASKMTVAQRRTGACIRAVEYEEIEEHTGESSIFARDPYLVDLGLSVRWCDVNLGYECIDATYDGVDMSSESCSYFAWGETAPKENYTWANYKHANGSASTVKNIGSNIQATAYDVAYSCDDYYGGNGSTEAPRRHAPGNGMLKTATDPDTEQEVDICMPTKAQFEELLTKCTWKVVSGPSYKYYKVTGPNGNYIELPFSGTWYDGSLHNEGTSAYYWTSEVYSSDTQKANALYIKDGTTPKMSYAQRRTGLPIRAVEYKKSTPPTPDTHDYVNLGLSSGTLWATCNVGASSPEGYGNFYAWGETKTKSTYSWSNYQYCNGSSSSVVDIGTHIAGTSYDAAKAAWGSNWVMPTIDQTNELVHECSISLATVNNVKCIRFKGPNGNSIVFPMTGYMADSSHKNEGTQCYLWTETKDIVSHVDYKALAMYLERSTSSAKVNTQAAPKRSGVVIRAVRAGSGSANSYAFDTDDVRGVTTTAPSDDATYTLQGVKVEGNLKPGIYIRNGKKIVLK